MLVPKLGPAGRRSASRCSRPLTALSAVVAITLTTAGAIPAAGAAPRASSLKGVWGPIGPEASRYLDQAAALGAKRYYTTLRWADVSTGAPVDGTDPSDPSYVWPVGLDELIADAKRRGIKVVLNVTTAPRWASGSGDASTPPRNPQTFARFTAAASRRYPGVAGWQIWSEPTKPQNWSGLGNPEHPNSPLTASQRRAPVLYARMLDASYSRLRKVDRSDAVIGGNTWTAGQISPYQWIRYMKLPNGKRPRMTMYGHNPFSARSARLSDGPRVAGYADISDTDDLIQWLDRWQRRDGRRLPVLFSEFNIPQDRKSEEFNYYVSAKTAARWTSAALRLVRREDRLAGIAWVGLFDQTLGGGAEYTTGLLDAAGNPKPAFDAFSAG